MKYDLSRLGIEKGLQYECITTTMSKDGIKNAGAFAFIYLGKGNVRCHIFEGSKTLKNILDTKEYVVNITQDPLVFTYATLDCLGDEYFAQDDGLPIIKDAPSYIIVDVEDVEIKTPENLPIKGDNSIYFIYGKIRNVVINDETVKAYNHGMSGLIEGLVNLSRYKIVDDAKRQEYMAKLIENQRVIEKVSDEKTKKAMAKLMAEYKKN